MDHSVRIGISATLLIAGVGCSQGEAPQAHPAPESRQQPSGEPNHHRHSAATDSSVISAQGGEVADGGVGSETADEQTPADTMAVGRSSWNILTREHIGGQGAFVPVLNEERLLRQRHIAMRVIADPGVAQFYSIATHTEPCYTDNRDRGGISIDCDVEMTRNQQTIVVDGGPPPMAPTLTVSCVTASGATVLFNSAEGAPRIATAPGSPAPGSKVLVQIGRLWHCWQHDGTTLRVSVAPPPQRRSSDYY